MLNNFKFSLPVTVEVGEDEFRALELLHAPHYAPESPEAAVLVKQAIHRELVEYVKDKFKVKVQHAGPKSAGPKNQPSGV